MVKVVALATLLAFGLSQPNTSHFIYPDIPKTFETILASVSAYTTAPDETDSDNLITASGKVAEEGMIACPSRFEFGTIVEIKGREFVCEDRMSRQYRAGNFFDILMKTKHDAFMWGRQIVEVRVIHTGLLQVSFKHDNI